MLLTNNYLLSQIIDYQYNNVILVEKHKNKRVLQAVGLGKQFVTFFLPAFYVKKQPFFATGTLRQSPAKATVCKLDFT